MILYCIAILSILQLQVLSQPPTCPLGSNASLQNFPFERPLFERSHSLLIDLGNCARCNGTMTAWDYCAHSVFNDNQETQYSATFVVFRRRGSDPNQYSAVQGSMAELRLNVSSDPVSCGSLNLRDQIHVEEGDIVGACVVTKSGFYRNVGVVSTGSTTPTEVYISQPIFNQCQRNSIVDINISNNFNLREALVLHLSARIVTSEDPTSTENGQSGGGDESSEGSGNSGDSEDEGGGDPITGGAVAGIVLVVLVVVSVGAVLLPVLYLKYLQYNSDPSGSTPEEGNVGDQSTEMTQNQAYGLVPENEIKTTQNQVYELGTVDETKTTQNQGYGLNQYELSHEQLQQSTEAYEAIDYDYETLSYEYEN